MKKPGNQVQQPVSQNKQQTSQQVQQVPQQQVKQQQQQPQQQQQSQGQPVTVMIFCFTGKFKETFQTNDTFDTLKQKVKQLINLEKNQFTLHLGSAQEKKIDVIDKAPLISFGIKHGSQIYVNELKKREEFKTKTETWLPNVVDDFKCKHDRSQKCANCIPKVEEPAESNQNTKETKICNHPPGWGCKCAEQAKQKELEEKKQEEVRPPCKGCTNEKRCNICKIKCPKNHRDNERCDFCPRVVTSNQDKPKCNHAKNIKCPECIGGTGGMRIDAKFKAFDAFLYEKAIFCQHNKTSKCVNCMPPKNFDYSGKGSTESVNLKLQEFRHIDNVLINNMQEFSNFRNYYKEHQGMQRIGYLYGYYASDPDPKYEYAIRAIVEVIYEPPQQTNHSNQSLQKAVSKGEYLETMIFEDQYAIDVSQIASALGLEQIGWIYNTKQNGEKCKIESEMVRRAARQQWDHRVEHECGYTVSKFISMLLRENEEKNTVEEETYMISDQIVAMERDGVFTDSKNDNEMTVREEDKNKKKDFVPTIVFNNGEAKTFDCDACLVHFSSGAPHERIKNAFNIIKNYDFPVENREQQITTNDIKNYLKKHAKDPAESRFANFHLLVALRTLNILDIHSVIGIAEAVNQEQPIPQFTEEILGSLKL